MLEVRVVPPDSSWVAQFQLEASLIRATLFKHNIEIHHIGSTAIAGVHAKPIIDMMLLIDDLSIADNEIAAIQALGYEALGEFGILGRRYFRKNTSSGIRTHHVHAFERHNDNGKRHLAFRDYMNSNPTAAQEYSLLKQRLAKESSCDMEGYMNGKDEFIKHHQALALSERASG
jgi:GrpB-like predicted nucleotidyltransferase (UPF0157 family)